MKNMWRVLIRIEDVTGKGFSFVIPGWSYVQTFYWSFDKVPAEISDRIKENQKYFHAMMNLDCETVDEVVIEDWEKD